MLWLMKWLVSGQGSDETVVDVGSETQRWPSQSRKESILNYLLIETRGLDTKQWSQMRKRSRKGR